MNKGVSKEHDIYFISTYPSFASALLRRSLSVAGGSKLGAEDDTSSFESVVELLG